MVTTRVVFCGVVVRIHDGVCYTFSYTVVVCVALLGITGGSFLRKKKGSALMTLFSTYSAEHDLMDSQRRRSHVC